VRKENQGGTVDELLYASGNYSFTSDGMKCFLVDSDNPRSRIGQAKAALREIVSQIADINVGIGRFEKNLVLNRFRAKLPADLDQISLLDTNWNYDYWDGQIPNIGQINIPVARHHGISGLTECTTRG